MKKTKEQITKLIIDTVAELGVFIDYDGENDFDMSIYFEDSISFISIIVSLEEALKIEFPEELLLLENYSSFERIVDVIYDLM